MRECKITKNPAKEWMNARIDMDPDRCPWERVDGIKTMFVLKRKSEIVALGSQLPNTLS
jgi:hypothetical protein